MNNLGVSIDFLEFPPAHTHDGQNISPKIAGSSGEAVT
jgi:hypothetical protein